MRILGRNAIVSSFIFGILFTLPGLLPGMSAATAPAQFPQQTLNQYVADLQKNPNDYALREKIIRHAQTMKPSPAVPREAERFMNRGAAAAKSAKDANDFKDAVAEFEKATLSAPWMANAYYNLGVAQDKAGMYSNAIRSLKLYLVAAPNAPDAKSVEKLIDEIEYRQEKAAKESSPAVVAAKKQQIYEEWLRILDGTRFFGSYNVLNSYWKSELTIRGSKLYWQTSCVRGEGCIAGWFVKCRAGEMQIVERQAKCIDEVAPASWNVVSDIFTISKDGKSITHAQQATNGRTFTYYCQ